MSYLMEMHCETRTFGYHRSLSVRSYKGLDFDIGIIVLGHTSMQYDFNEDTRKLSIFMEGMPMNCKVHLYKIMQRCSGLHYVFKDERDLMRRLKNELMYYAYDDPDWKRKYVHIFYGKDKYDEFMKEATKSSD